MPLLCDRTVVHTWAWLFTLPFLDGLLDTDVLLPEAQLWHLDFNRRDDRGHFRHWHGIVEVDQSHMGVANAQNRVIEVLDEPVRLAKDLRHLVHLNRLQRHKLTSPNRVPINPNQSLIPHEPEAPSLTFDWLQNLYWPLLCFISCHLLTRLSVGQLQKLQGAISEHIQMIRFL